MSQWTYAGSLQELQSAGAKVIKGGIAVFVHERQVYAVDNRCPHMGFPLHMGSLCDGILTCHWHHARFDICSGGTLDPWADDVPTYEVKVEEGGVWVHPEPRTRGGAEKHLKRLREGLEQNISLVLAKSVIALLDAGVPEQQIARVGIEYGIVHRSRGWGSGLTILAAMVNILPKLDRYGRILALFHGLRRVAADCAGSPPRFLLEPLPDTEASLERLAAWYRQCVEVRDTQGAERVLLTAIRQGAAKNELADMMLAAVTDHFYLDGGHTFDFHNKAFEMLEHLDEGQEGLVLASLVPLLANPTRSEERNNWRHPINLVAPLWEAFAKLPDIREAADDDSESAVPLDEEALVELLLGDEPLETIAAITAALVDGVSPVRIARLAALAAAERIVRFHTQNDFGDWIAVLHTFTHAHAVHKSLLRGSGTPTVRAVYYSAVSIYLDRFLNIPTAPKANPEQAAKRGHTTDPSELLELLNQRQQVEQAADWAAHYMSRDGDVQALFNTLGHSLLREDAEFHSYQMLEAGIQEYDRWSELSGPLAKRAQETMVLAITRYLAAHAPTARELPHVARIAWRLHRGERLFEE
ncbi:Rieske (2Fe-2S) protein [Paenibacillus sp. J2TS4]|uniref:Rieske (2Fe-2S) protein n=1 Tax=Paenibacillus sp. J2TS4 TaxID=2807194 RepID=UPI001B0428F9|nr:Rieske (2Fe-2S) protein [Paenibacillus sp. J2TS4]GIP34979.1 hypothetical protein J2TS4_41890 [Paenibacillus sp. J2TS4]